MDYIPRSDKDFDNFSVTFCDYTNTNFAALGLTVAQNTTLQALKTTWQTDYPAHILEQAKATSVAQKKDITRSKFEKVIREFSGIMQSNAVVTNDQKGALGITIPKTTKTPTPVPATRPIGKIDNVNRLEHIVQFFDESTQNSKAKPDGVRACEIWIKVGGTPPLDEKEIKYLATDTKSPHIVHFAGEDIAKMAHYMLRWVNSRNEPGPWSETISVTISG